MVHYSFPRSDGSATVWPPANVNRPSTGVIIDIYRPSIDPNSNPLKMWNQKVGAALADHFNEQGDGHLMAELPADFRLFVQETQKGSAGAKLRKDVYLYGRLDKKRYRSPAEFVPHAVWLLSDETLNQANCRCGYCSGGGMGRTFLVPTADGSLARERDIHPTYSPSRIQSPALARLSKARSLSRVPPSRRSAGPDGDDGMEGVLRPLKKGPMTSRDFVSPIRLNDLKDWKKGEGKRFRHSELVWIPIDRISESQDPSQHIDYWPAVIKEVCYVARTAGWEYVCIAVGLNHTARLDQAFLLPFLAYDSPTELTSTIKEVLAGMPDLPAFMGPDRPKLVDVRKNWPLAITCLAVGLTTSQSCRESWLVTHPMRTCGTSVTGWEGQEHQGIWLGAERVWLADWVRLTSTRSSLGSLDLFPPIPAGPSPNPPPAPTQAASSISAIGAPSSSALPPPALASARLAISSPPNSQRIRGSPAYETAMHAPLFLHIRGIVKRVEPSAEEGEKGKEACALVGVLYEIVDADAIGEEDKLPSGNEVGRVREALSLGNAEAGPSSNYPSLHHRPTPSTPSTIKGSPLYPGNVVNSDSNSPSVLASSSRPLASAPPPSSHPTVSSPKPHPPPPTNGNSSPPIRSPLNPLPLVDYLAILPPTTHLVPSELPTPPSGASKRFRPLHPEGTEVVLSMMCVAGRWYPRLDKSFLPFSLASAMDGQISSTMRDESGGGPSTLDKGKGGEVMPNESSREIGSKEGLIGLSERTEEDQASLLCRLRSLSGVDVSPPRPSNITTTTTSSSLTAKDDEEAEEDDAAAEEEELYANPDVVRMGSYDLRGSREECITMGLALAEKRIRRLWEWARSEEGVLQATWRAKVRGGKEGEKKKEADRIRNGGGGESSMHAERKDEEEMRDGKRMRRSFSGASSVGGGKKSEVQAAGGSGPRTERLGGPWEGEMDVDEE